MSYYFSKTVDMPFTTAINHVTNKLANKGFGVLTSIDVQQVMKAKLGVDFKPYVILGACNPHFAWRALQAYPHCRSTSRRRARGSAMTDCAAAW